MFYRIVHFVLPKRCVSLVFCEQSRDIERALWKNKNAGTNIIKRLILRNAFEIYIAARS